MIIEPVPQYACKSGKTVDFSTEVESRETEVSAGFVSTNQVRRLSSLDDRRLELSAIHGSTRQSQHAGRGKFWS